jgi:glycosyltransferase involved in cell wall biosynthesis
MPCLNEAATVGQCIAKARAVLSRNHLEGEIIVADNGSTDGCPEIAARMNARVVQVRPSGYGHALTGGILATRGELIVIGDSDDSYDFTSIMPFVQKLRQGYDLVLGNRFRGGIRRGAMPWLHRVGNPILTGCAQVLFSAPVGDIYCGLRGFRRSAYERMQLRAAGMEFAAEMVIKATQLGLKITEVPIVLHPDGRSGPSHLRTWRDGFRTLRLMLELGQGPTTGECRPPVGKSPAELNP